MRRFVLAWVWSTAVGAVVLGLGSRGITRIVGALATPEHAGELTNAGNVVGAVTLGGTLGLMVPGAFAGGLAGLLYLGVRWWLPRAGLLRGLSFGLLLLAVLGHFVIGGNERDFRLAAPLFGLVSFALLFVFDGLLTAFVAERVEPGLPPQQPSVIGSVVLAAVIVLGLSALTISATAVLGAV